MQKKGRTRRAIVSKESVQEPIVSALIRKQWTGMWVIEGKPQKMYSLRGRCSKTEISRKALTLSSLPVVEGNISD